jgi:quinoprotein glucose dehydrogenase
MRFSPLMQITPATVGQLAVAWVYHEACDHGGAGSRRRRRPGKRRFRVQLERVTPLVVNGTMYLSTPYSRVVAVDPTTARRWAFQLPSEVRPPAGLNTGRGRPTSPQIVFGSSDGKLYSLDAKTASRTTRRRPGRRQSEFARNPAGAAGSRRTELAAQRLQESGDHGRNDAGESAEGWPATSAWDMHTGALVWTFHRFPGAKNTTTPGLLTVGRTDRRERLGFLTVDAERGIITCRLARRRSISARWRPRRRQSLQQQPGGGGREYRKVLWHFQIVHHDIWDADLTGAPALIDVKQGGRRFLPSPINKVGLLFLLDRVTGTPIYGVEERAVPQTEVPPEHTVEDAAIPAEACAARADDDERRGYRDRHA